MEPARPVGQLANRSSRGRLSLGDLRRAAAEVLITSTAGGILPATVIHGKLGDRALLHGDEQ